jgi:hypothetical protein
MSEATKIDSTGVSTSPGDDIMAEIIRQKRTPDGGLLAMADIAKRRCREHLSIESTDATWPDQKAAQELAEMAVGKSAKTHAGVVAQAELLILLEELGAIDMSALALRFCRNIVRAPAAA